MRLARQAGAAAAMIAVSTITIGTLTNVSGSSGSTPKRNVATASAAHDRQVERGEVSGIGGRVLRARPIARLDRRIADDLEDPLAQLARAVRQARRPAHAADVGQAADVAAHRIVELCDRFRRWIA